MLRNLTKGDLQQAAKASHYLESNCTKENPGYINRIIPCEIIWVLAQG